MNGNVSQLVGTQTYSKFDKIDFNKPEKYIKEIAHFFQAVTLLPNNFAQKLTKIKSINASEAHLMISHLLLLMVPNLKED